MMKLLLIAGFFLLTFTSPIWGVNDEPKEIDVPIEIGPRPGDDNSSIDPRTPEFVTFTCYYRNGAVYLSNENNLGVSEFVVTNQNSGESWSVQPGCATMVMLPTSGESGTYLVEIYTVDNKHFLGYYTLS
ncbi:MAG: hypothetical protein IJ341_12435 [Bacteroidales bacterium]|nr:hypothetical protein [Bacteroidales bacterium]